MYKVTRASEQASKATARARGVMPQLRYGRANAKAIPGYSYLVSDRRPLEGRWILGDANEASKK